MAQGIAGGFLSYWHRPAQGTLLEQSNRNPIVICHGIGLGYGVAYPPLLRELVRRADASGGRPIHVWSPHVSLTVPQDYGPSAADSVRATCAMLRRYGVDETAASAAEGLRADFTGHLRAMPAFRRASLPRPLRFSCLRHVNSTNARRARSCGHSPSIRPVGMPAALPAPPHLFAAPTTTSPNLNPPHGATRNPHPQSPRRHPQSPSSIPPRRHTHLCDAHPPRPTPSPMNGTDGSVAVAHVIKQVPSIVRNVALVDPVAAGLTAPLCRLFYEPDVGEIGGEGGVVGKIKGWLLHSDPRLVGVLMRNFIWFENVLVGFGARRRGAAGGDGSGGNDHDDDDAGGDGGGNDHDDDDGGGDEAVATTTTTTTAAATKRWQRPRR